ELSKLAGEAKKDEGGWAYNLRLARDRFNAYRDAEKELRTGRLDNVQNGKLAVDLSCDAAYLRTQSQVSATAQRWLGRRTCLEVGGVGIDEASEGDMKTVTVKAMSPAYFRILERHPEAKKVFSVGNHLVWVTPSRTALIVDMSSGAESMADTAIDALF